nr:RecName: Full=Uncharacterized protein DR7 [Human herpesvirus 6 (strain Uganda-1102)]
MRHLPFHGMPLRVQMFCAFFIRSETTDKNKATPTITFMVSCCFVWVKRLFYRVGRIHHVQSLTYARPITALDSCLYVCCGYGEKLQPVGFVKSYVTNSQLDTLRVLLVGKDGAVYVHHMRAARLCRLASSTTEFTRRGLQRDAVTYEEDLELPDQRMCGTNARHLFDVIAAAADEHNLLTVGGLCQTHAGVSCNLLETVGDPWTAVPAARMTLTVPQVQYRLWPEARRDLRRHLYAGHPLGPWLVCGVLSRERETQKPSPPIRTTVGNVPTPGPREVEIAWVVLTLAGPLLAFWPDTGKICRLANSFSTLWKMGPRAMRGHWTYSAPGRHLPGDAWPLCEHVRPQWKASEEESVPGLDATEVK